MVSTRYFYGERSPKLDNGEGSKTARNVDVINGQPLRKKYKMAPRRLCRRPFEPKVDLFTQFLDIRLGPRPI